MGSDYRNRTCIKHLLSIYLGSETGDGNTERLFGLLLALFIIWNLGDPPGFDKMGGIGWTVATFAAAAIATAAEWFSNGKRESIIWLPFPMEFGAKILFAFSRLIISLGTNSMDYYVLTYILRVWVALFMCLKTDQLWSFYTVASI